MSEPITFMLTSSESARLREVAKATGLSLSGITRLAVLGDAEMSAVVQIGRRAMMLQEQVKKLEASTEAVRYITGK